MLRQKCSYKNDIGTCKKLKSEGNATKVCNLTKTTKS